MHFVKSKLLKGQFIPGGDLIHSTLTHYSDSQLNNSLHVDTPL
jgi:hypothetical protein